LSSVKQDKILLSEEMAKQLQSPQKSMTGSIIEFSPTESNSHVISKADNNKFQSIIMESQETTAKQSICKSSQESANTSQCDESRRKDT
jgi:hypothetical protein